VRVRVRVELSVGCSVYSEKGEKRMSHFAVLVPAGGESELYERLIPYYEYGASTERDDDLKQRGLLEFVSVEEKYRQEYDDSVEWDRYESFEQFMNDWAGYEFDEEHDAYGYYHNPDSKWDSYRIGGRASGILSDGMNGYTPEDDPRNSSNSPLAGMVDWHALRAKRLEKASERWNQYREDYGFWYILFYRWAGLLYHLSWPLVYKVKWWFVRTGFHKLSRWLLKKLTTQEITPNWKYGIKAGQSYRQFMAREGGAVTHAFVDLDGGWNQRGEMGWWGISDEDEGTPDYDEAFWRFVHGLPPEQRVYVVDCHI